MTWRTRSPQSFPAHFNRVLLEAIINSPRSILFGSYPTEDSADSVAHDFRYFRWCLRQQPGVFPKLTEAETSFQFRLSREETYDLTKRWIVLYLTATPDRLGELETLNPHLGSIIAGTE